MKTSIRTIGVALLVLSVFVGMASAAGSSYDNAEEIDVLDEDTTIFGPYSSAPEEWWWFEAAAQDDIYVDLSYVFTSNGGELRLHDEFETDVQAYVVSTNPAHNDYYARLDKDHPHIQINRGSSTGYSFIVGRND